MLRERIMEYIENELDISYLREYLQSAIENCTDMDIQIVNMDGVALGKFAYLPFEEMNVCTININGDQHTFSIWQSDDYEETLNNVLEEIVNLMVELDISEL